jgi:hypothetical protein
MEVSISNQSLQSKVWGFHGGDYDDYHHGVISQKMIIISLCKVYSIQWTHRSAFSNAKCAVRERKLPRFGLERDYRTKRNWPNMSSNLQNPYICRRGRKVLFAVSSSCGVKCAVFSDLTWQGNCDWVTATEKHDSKEDKHWFNKQEIIQICS